MDKFKSFKEENTSYWSKRAQGYSYVNQEELSSGQRAVWQKVIDSRIRAAFPEKTPNEIHVLDIGTGPGFFSIILSERGYRVTAIDYTPAMLAEARHNAGELGEKIEFCQMDAEKLRFPDNAFDVIVSRNVTWNLHAPEKAYRHWIRVLKPGGLLLNFDANWYRYLWNSEAELEHLEDRKNLALSDVRDETAGTDVDAMEAIARKTPHSRNMRPAWDLEVLEHLCLLATADTEIWKQVWTREERINNASTPMFLIAGIKAV